MMLKTKNHPIKVPNVLLPKAGINLNKWAVIACDQYTSQPAYWNELKDYVEGSPSTYQLILPEVYLESITPTMINKINTNMKDYLDKGLLKPVGEAMILVERIMKDQTKRLGLMITVDLEAYDYKEGSKPLIRTTEKTIIERIPPRVQIREKALFELSHVMLLVDDVKRSIIEQLYKTRSQYPVLYDFPLNMDGGHIKAYKITDCDPVLAKFNDLIKGQRDPMMFVAGDGNHSLATAKAHWVELKKNLTDSEIKDHPARFSLVEVVNIYDEGLHFEGIHRVIFNAKQDFLVGLFHAVDREVETWIYEKQAGESKFFIPGNSALAYEQIQHYIDTYMDKNPETTIDYIHGEKDLREICDKNPNSIGIKMPCIQREALFPYIKKGKVLPRKSFSMGSADSKRYYLECNLITKD